MNYSFITKFRMYVNSSMVLIFFTVMAMICANIPDVKVWYNEIWTQEVSLAVGNFNFFSHHGQAITLRQMINDFLMAIFFLSVGLEIKREVMVGELSSRQKALLPVIGACGGMIVPVLIFFLICPGNAEMQRGLAIPMATDIAFSLGILSVFKTRVPFGLKMFLAALAVADDLGGILVIAIFYSSSINMFFILLSALCVAIMVVGNVMKVHSKAFYISVGLVLWYMMLNSGIHATIAGVIVAFCIPSNLQEGTGYYLERIRRNVSRFPVIEVSKRRSAIVLTNEQISTLKRIESAADKMISPLQDMEDRLHTPINYAVLPLFAFANAGIDLSQMSVGDVFSGVSLAVMLGLVLGKFIGVYSFSWLAVRLCIVNLPNGATWQSFAGVCVVCGIGFTVSMFISELSYAGLGAAGAELLSQAKLGVLCGSFISALLGCYLLNKALPKKKMT